MQKFDYKIPFLITLLVAAGMAVGIAFKPMVRNAKKDDSINKYGDVLKLVEESYVDTPDEGKLSDAAIDAMLKELDPHSVYIPAKEVMESNEELEGSFEGVGIEFNTLNDTIVVISAISGGPSEAVGIHAGDKIISIEDKTAAGVHLSTEDIKKALRGPKRTKVKIGVERGGDKKLLYFTITRNKIPLYTVDAAYMVTPTIGYIKINRFGATTIEEYNEAIKKLRNLGMKDLVLDLTNNPGGYLKAAITLAQDFLFKDQLIVYTQGRVRPKQIYQAEEDGQFKHGRLAVMVDEGSASASEIVSGAIQDQDRGIIVGRRSFGKGLVQEPFMLNDRSEVRLTVARYYTPSGRSIQKSYKKGLEDYEEDLSNRIKHGELYSRDSIKFNDSLKYLTAHKRTVYGGGGIMPDIFVPLDTSENSDYLHNLSGKGIFSEFVAIYMEHNRERIVKEYPDFGSFSSNFIIDENILNQFAAYGIKSGIKRDEKGMNTSGKFIRMELKALIAKQIFHNEGFFKVINEQNEVLKKAVEALKGNSYTAMKISE